MVFEKNKYITRESAMYLVVLAVISALFGLVLPFSILIIFDRVVPNAATTTLIFLYLIILGAVIADFKVQSIEEKFILKITKKFESELTEKIFKSLCNANIERFNKYEAGEYLERIRTIPALKNYFAGDTVKAVVNAITCVIIASVIAIINNVAGLVLVIASIILYIISSILAKKKKEKIEEKSALEGSASSKIVEIVSFPLNLKTASMEYRMENFMDDVVKEREERSIELEKLESWMPLSLEFIQQLSVAMVVVASAISVIDFGMSQGGMAAIVLLTNRFFSPYRQIMSMFGQWEINKMQLERIDDIMQLEEEHSQNNDIVPVQKITVKADNKYNFKKGNIYVVTGASCSGKTLLMQSIALERSNSDINIDINGKPLDQYVYGAWKNSIISVNKDSSFIEGTIIENITCFRPKLYKAAYALCEALNVKEVIDKLPRGFYTELKGTKNYPFSRQVHFSLLIIRALLCKKSILIIDDVDLIYDKNFEHNIIRCIESRSDSIVSFFVSNKIKTEEQRIIHTPINRIITPKGIEVKA